MAGTLWARAVGNGAGSTRVLATMLVATGASMAFAGGGDDGDDDGGDVIRLVDKVASETDLDRGETGFGAGDRFVFATLSLPGGQIAVQGLVTFTNEEDPFTVAVTGGTGRYREADGEMTIETVSDTEDHFTIRLR